MPGITALMTSRLFRPPSLFRSATLAATLGVALLAAAPASAGLFGSDPVPPAGIPGQQDAAQQAVRMDNMEQQMRQLNGRIDELTHQIQQLQNLLQRAQEDNEFRLKQLEGGKGQKRSDVAPPAAAPAANQAASAGAPMVSVGEGETLQAGFAIDAPGTVAATPPPVDATLGAPPTPLGTLPGAMADSAAPSASAVTRCPARSSARAVSRRRSGSSSTRRIVAIPVPFRSDPSTRRHPCRASGVG